MPLGHLLTFFLKYSLCEYYHTRRLTHLFIEQMIILISDFVSHR